MASSHLELKQDSVFNSNNEETHDVKDAEEVGSQNAAEDVAKEALLKALFSTNHQVIDVILQNHPGLVNFEYMCEGRYPGTPLQITCSTYHNYVSYDDDTGICLLYHNIIVLPM